MKDKDLNASKVKLFDNEYYDLHVTQDAKDFIESNFPEERYGDILTYEAWPLRKLLEVVYMAGQEKTIEEIERLKIDNHYLRNQLTFKVHSAAGPNAREVNQKLHDENSALKIEVDELQGALNNKIDTALLFQNSLRQQENRNESLQKELDKEVIFKNEFKRQIIDLIETTKAQQQEINSLKELREENQKLKTELECPDCKNTGRHLCPDVGKPIVINCCRKGCIYGENTRLKELVEKANKIIESRDYQKWQAAKKEAGIT